MASSQYLILVFLALLFFLTLASNPSPIGSTKCHPTNSSCYPTQHEFDDLSSTLTDGIVYPWDISRWSSITELHNGRLDTDHMPHRAVYASSQDDIVAVVNFCRANNLLLSIKSTGHCYSGNCMSQDSIHLDLSKMNSISYDKASETVTLGPGANFDGLYSLCESESILAVGGMCGTVGPVGFSLGGGHGPLIRSYGLGVDQIVSLTVVLASGEVVLLNAPLLSKTERALRNGDILSIPPHPLVSNLWYALRGGGGGTFAVVSSITVRSHPSPPQLVSLACSWPLLSSDERPGVDVLSDWYSGVMSSLPKEWSFYTILLREPIPIQMRLPKYDSNTMKGVLSLEGLYNGVWSSEMLAAVKSITEGLSPSSQLDCSFTNHSSFKAWHDSRWFGKVPLKTRNYM